MDTSIFEKFNQKFDVDALAADAKNAGGDRRELVDVPFGDYEVKIDKLEMCESKKSGDPQMRAWFRVLTGEYKNQMIFMYQPLTSGFGIKKCCEFLSSLSDDFDISFVDYVQFATLIEEIREDITGKFEYELSYTENKKGFKTFEIVQRFAAGEPGEGDDLPF